MLPKLIVTELSAMRVGPSVSSGLSELTRSARRTSPTVFALGLVDDASTFSITIPVGKAAPDNSAAVENREDKQVSTAGA
jgi:hypothetical protein